MKTTTDKIESAIKATPNLTPLELTLNARTEAKLAIIDRILDNGTYLPDSGMRKALRKSLLKLSRSDLGNLEIITLQKTNDNRKQ